MLKNLYGQKRVKHAQQELNAILTAHERYVSYQGGVRAQLTHAELDGLNLANRILKEAELSGASLVGATLYGSNLERASLYCADLRGCNLQAANLRRADLRGASLKGAVLSYAVLDGADMRSAMMMYVGPGGVSLLDHNNASGNGQDEDGVNTATGVDFSNCSLKHASFGSAKLDNVNFGGALLEGAKFKGARLKNAVFKGAVLTGVDLKELDVPAHALEGCVKDPTAEAIAKAQSLKDALATHQEWVGSGGKTGRPASLDGQDLRPLKSELKARVLAALSARRTNAIGVDFSGCQLQAAKFDGADLRDCDFSDADLRGASFKGARLAHAHFHGANLGGLPMASGTALNPDFSGSDAIAEQFIGAQLDAPLADLGLPTSF